MSDFLKSQTFKRVLYALGVFLVLLLVFQVGVFTGFRKATFSYRWAENYENNFGGPRGRGLLPGIGGDSFINGHGTAGQIIKLDTSGIVVRGQDNTEKLISVSGDTRIVRNRQVIRESDLKAGDFIVVIGSPNASGRMDAELIRVLPAPPPPFPQNGTSTLPAKASTTAR
jgi:hypothetical protein